jgi:peptidoglycan/LPS O-acetylase OafA/YrhL
LMAVLIFCCARYKNGVVRLVSGKWIVLGGEVSYSMYLLHFLIIGAFRYQAATISSWNVALGAFLQLIVVLAAIIGLSLVSWNFIEVPCRRGIRSLLSVAGTRIKTLPGEPATS